MVLTSMTIKNPLRRFARCRMYDSPGGCDHFEWIDDSICDEVRSMVVSLIVLNKTLVQENEHLQRMKEEAASDRDAMKRLREKTSRLKMDNSRLKIQLVDYQMRERKILWRLLLLFGLVISVDFAVGSGK